MHFAWGAESKAKIMGHWNCGLGATGACGFLKGNGPEFCWNLIEAMSGMLF